MNTYTLDQLCIRITDGKHGDCQSEVDSGYYFISCKDIYEGKIDYSSARQITKKDFDDTHRRTQLEADDILITNSGTIGRMALVKDEDITYRTTFQKSVAILKPLQDIVLPKYLYYRLMSVKDRLVNDSNGAAQKNLLLSTMRSFKLSIDEDNEQQRFIADILSAYDDLIENNLKQIRLLEEAAMRLYREWFVNLRFPGHETTNIVDGVPEGWSKKSINDLMTFHRGYDLTKNNMQGGFFPVVGSTSIIGYHNEFKIKGPGIVTGRSGSLGTYQFIWEDFWPHNTSLYICDYKGHDIFYVFCLLKTVDFSSLNNGGAIPTLNRNTLSNIIVLEPHKNLQERFAKIAKSLFERVYIANKQISLLKQARDKLLPKFMTGEIQV